MASILGQTSQNQLGRGILTASVNAQLITDAHRAEWAIDGAGFVVPKAQDDEARASVRPRFSRIYTILAFFGPF